MALRRHLVITASRGLVHASRRCRTSKSVTHPSSLRGVSSSSTHAYNRTAVPNTDEPARPPDAPTELVKKRNGGRWVVSRGCQRVLGHRQLRALSTDPVPGGNGGSASSEEGVFIRAGGEFGTDGDPGPPPPLDPSIVTGPSEKVLKVMEDIEALDLMEVTMLIDVFKEKMGLDEVPSLNFGGEGGVQEVAAAADAEKSLFNVNVTGFNEKSKIKVIKEIRAITGLGLREAKELVDGLPKVIKTDVKKEEGEKIVETLKAVGAMVTLE